MSFKKLYLIFTLAVGSVFGVNAAVTDTIVVPTANLPKVAKAVVIMPETGAAVGTKYPSVYLLNGYGGDYKSWTIIRPDLGKLADMYGMVIVMPDGMDSWYWNSPKIPEMKMEDFFVNDLVPYIDANYPTKEESAQRAIAGLSMGGHGAMWLAIRHKDIWGNAATMSGGVDIRPFTSRWRMKQLLGEYETNTTVWDEHTVINLVPALQPGELNIEIDCGVDDFFADVNRNLHQALLDSKIPHDYVERPGAHTRAYWANSVLYQLLFFNECFSK